MAQSAQQTYRQQRHRTTREHMVQAAVELAGELGWANVTMRLVADRVKYTHAALYAYFASKDDLLLAVLEKGLQLLRQHLETAHAGASTPETALRAVVAAYWAFAWQHPELYQVMHGLGGVAFSTSITIEDGKQVGTPAGDSISALLIQHGKAPRDVERKVDLLWSTLHGLVTLTMAGRFERQHATELVEQGINDALTAWGVHSTSNADER